MMRRYRVVAVPAGPWGRVRGWPRILALSALGLVGALAGCASGAYEDAAREVAAEVGAAELVVHDSVSNFARNSGRTVRFAVRDDPIAVVPLDFVRPGVCDEAGGGSCADQLRRNLARARGQSAFAARLAQAFAPCGFYGAVDVALVNVGAERHQQFAKAYVMLNRAVAPGEEEAARDEVASCAGTLAAEVDGGGFALDDVADWAARPVSLVVELKNRSGLPEPQPPLIAHWDDQSASGEGPYYVTSARLGGGQAQVNELKRGGLPG